MTTNIPILRSTLPSSKKLKAALLSVFEGGILAEGDYVYEFEKKFSQIFNIKNVLAVSSGTAAIHMALLLANIKNDDEVITTSMTAEPTNTAILQAGAFPVFADICMHTGNIDPQSIEMSITKKTKAIIVVHYAGYPAKIKEIMRIARKYKLIVIEDCAHALGAMVEGKSVGTFGDFAIFSFQAVKHITTIDGGMLVMKNIKHISRAKKMRWFGLTKGKPRHLNRITELGYKYNMTNISAVIGILQLETFARNLKKYIYNGNFLTNELNKGHLIKPASVSMNEFPSYWFFTGIAKNSTKIIKNLNQYNIGASKVHIPNHKHPIFFKSVRHPLTNTEIFYKKLIHLPTGWWVNKNNLKLIIEIINKE